MAIKSWKELVDKKVYAQHGREVGKLVGLDLDVDEWRIANIEVKLNRDVLEELHLKRPVMGSQTVRVPVSQVSGVSDTVVLRPTLQDLAFAGGTPTEDPPKG